jgi:hypothetical protein
MQHAALERVGGASELRALVRASTAIRRFEPDFRQSARMRDAVGRLGR